MTAPRRVASGGSPRVLRRIGGVSVVVALSALGLAGGLWLGSPAAAATPPLQVKMTGDTAFSAAASGPLLNVTDLAPGASVSGSMDILDDSDSAVGSGWSDTMLLHLVGGTVGANCDLGDTGLCPAADQALRDALEFTVTVTGAGVGHASDQVATAAQLSAGMPLAAGLVNGDIVSLTVTAALADRDPALDNQMQYGKFGFDLGLSLDRLEPGGTVPGGPGTPDDETTPGDGTEGEDNEDGGSGGGTDPTQVTVISVAGTAKTGANGHGSTKARGDDGADDTSILVLDDNDSIAYTGVPVGLLLSTGGAMLSLGVILLVAGSRRRKVTR